MGILKNIRALFQRSRQNPASIAEMSGAALLPYQRRAQLNPSLDSVLQAGLGHFGLSYGVLLDQAGHFIAEAGSPDDLRFRGMALALLGPGDAPRNTYAWIAASQLRPQLYGQGGDFAVLDMPSEEVVLVVCGTPACLPPDLTVKEDYLAKSRMAKHFCDRLRPLL
jgi:hypothetical protein